MTQPRCYVITHKTSLVVQDAYKSLTKYNWTFEKFDAVDGKKITQQDWDKIGVKMSPTAGKLPVRPGAQGCWFSHFSLWERCTKINEPIIIMEHDIVVNGVWPTGIDIETCIVKLYKTADCKEKKEYGIWSKGSHAYTLTPHQAEKLLNRARTFGASPVDKHIISNIIPWKFLGYNLVTLNPGRGNSSTSGIIKNE